MYIERKEYVNLVNWKNNNNGQSVLFLQGCTQIGKTHLATSFSKEYKSSIILDCNNIPSEILLTLDGRTYRPDSFRKTLATYYNVELYEGDTLFIFDNIQKLSKIRKLLNTLIADGMYDYLVTGTNDGSLYSDSEVPLIIEKIKLFPLDFEEVCKAFGEDSLCTSIRYSFNNKIPLDSILHHKANHLFRKYLILGGMPNSIVKYLENDNSFDCADIEKRIILDKFRDEILGLDRYNHSKILSLFDQIPTFLSKQYKRVKFSSIKSGLIMETIQFAFTWLEDVAIASNCYNCDNSCETIINDKIGSQVKCFLQDTGLLFTYALDNVEEKIALRDEVLKGKLSVKMGMFCENIIEQALVTNGYSPRFYVLYNEISHRNEIEVDFIIKDKNEEGKCNPILVKHGRKYSTLNITRLKEKYPKHVGWSYVIYPGNLVSDGSILAIPPYMVFCI